MSQQRAVSMVTSKGALATTRPPRRTMEVESAESCGPPRGWQRRCDDWPSSKPRAAPGWRCRSSTARWAPSSSAPRAREVRRRSEICFRATEMAPGSAGGGNPAPRADVRMSSLIGPASPASPGGRRSGRRGLRCDGSREPERRHRLPDRPRQVQELVRFVQREPDLLSALDEPKGLGGFLPVLPVARLPPGRLHEQAASFVAADRLEVDPCSRGKLTGSARPAFQRLPWPE